MIDVHCHLNFHAFKNAVDTVIKNAFKDGVTKIINVGTKLDSSESAIKLAEKYNGLYATAGIHPHHADKLEENWEEKLENLAKHPKVVAIGEIGMDFYNYQSNNITDKKIQGEIFIKQLIIANKLKLPLEIHNRHAGKEILEVLNENKNLLMENPGLFHCFSGDIDFLKKVLDLGFFVGFDGNITYKGLARGETTDLKDLVRYTPIDRILIETDAPFLTPEPFRGGRNEPKYVIIIAKEIAKIKSVNPIQIEDSATQNAIRIFNLK